MNKHRQRGPGRRGRKNTGGFGNRSTGSPAGTGQRLYNQQERQFYNELPSLKDIFGRFMNTASQVVGELREPVHAEKAVQKKEIPNTSSKPLSYPVVDSALCTACGMCAEACPNGAISIDLAAVVDESLCTGCRACYDACPRGAITFVEEG